MDPYFSLLNLSFVANNHINIFTTFAKQSMINPLSNPINRNRSAVKISKVMSSTIYPCLWNLFVPDTAWRQKLIKIVNIETPQNTKLITKYGIWPQNIENTETDWKLLKMLNLPPNIENGRYPLPSYVQHSHLLQQGIFLKNLFHCWVFFYFVLR